MKDKLKKKYKVCQPAAGFELSAESTNFVNYDRNLFACLDSKPALCDELLDCLAGGGGHAGGPRGYALQRNIRRYAYCIMCYFRYEYILSMYILR